MIKDILKKSFFDVINNTSLALILVLFLIIFNFAAAYAIKMTSVVTLITSYICLLLIIVCFFSGWFQIFKEIAKNNPQEKRNPFGIYLEGVGKNTINIILGGIFYIIFLLAFFFIAGKIAYHFFGSLNFLSEESIPMLQNANAYGEFLAALPDEQKFALTGWLFTNVLAMALVNYIFMFFAPALIRDSQKPEELKKVILKTLLRPFCALCQSLKLIFKNFFEVIGLCIPIAILYIVIGSLSALFGANQLIELLILFVRIYFLSFVIMVVFNYYEAKTKDQDNCDNGCHRFRKNKPCDSISKED